MPGPDQPKQPETAQSPDYYRPVRTNEKITPLVGAELAKVRYQELTKSLINNKATKEAVFTFQWKGTGEEGYKESEHIMKAKGTLNPDKSLKLEGDGWSATIKPNGKIEGNMPNKLVQFLTYNRVEYDQKYRGQTTHHVDYVKQGFGEGGHSIITSPIYRDTGKENAEDILAKL